MVLLRVSSCSESFFFKRQPGAADALASGHAGLRGRLRRGFGLALGLSTLVMTASPAFAWGRMGHSIVGRAATELAEEGRLFWSANEDSIQQFSNTPDTAWKSGPSAADEKPTHWFHLDFYSPQGGALPSFFKVYAEVLKHYDEATVIDNGSATWRVQQFYLDALKHLRSSRYLEAVQLAGAMSHYIGDLAQPLHVTVNYDGQLTGQKGIHKYFETDNLEVVSRQELEDEVIRRAQKLMNDTAFRASFDQDLMHAMLVGTRRSLLDAPRILSIDKQRGRSGRGADEMREIATDRLADGVAMYALLLSRLWRDGGQTDNDRQVVAKEPKWLAPDYSQSADETSPRRSLRSGAVTKTSESRQAQLSRIVHEIGGSKTFVECE